MEHCYFQLKKNWIQSTLASSRWHDVHSCVSFDMYTLSHISTLFTICETDKKQHCLYHLYNAQQIKFLVVGIRVFSSFVIGYNSACFGTSINSSKLIPYLSFTIKIFFHHSCVIATKFLHAQFINNDTEKNLKLYSKDSSKNIHISIAKILQIKTIHTN